MKDTSEMMATIRQKMEDETLRLAFLEELSVDPIEALKTWRMSMTKDWQCIVDGQVLNHEWQEHLVRYAYMQSLAQ